MLLNAYNKHDIAIVIVFTYSRALIIRISITRILGYPNTILNFKIQKTPWFSAKSSSKWMSVWILDLLGLLYHSTVGRKAY